MEDDGLEWNIRMKRVEEAGAHLALHMEIQPHGLLTLAVPLLRHRERRELARDMATIKEKLEAE